MLDSPIVRLVASAMTVVASLCSSSWYRAWDTRDRVALPHWRNGIGLTAVFLLALAWLWFSVGLADTSLTPRLGAMYLDLTDLAVICTFLATAFASAWAGRSRLEVIAASALMRVGWCFFGYARIYITH